MSTPMPMPAPAPAGAFTDEMIAEVAAETGYPPEKVQADIQATGATSKEQLYPTFYGNLGIQPEGQTVGPGVVQGEVPAPAAVPPPAPMEGAPEGIPPEAIQQMRDAMAPAPAEGELPPALQRRAGPSAKPGMQGKGPRWHEATRG